jgi:hypothetical protein
MTVDEFVRLHNRPQSGARGFGYALLATPIADGVIWVLAGVLPNVIWAIMSIAVIVGVGFVVRSWWWPVISSLPCVLLGLLAALLWLSFTESNADNEVGFAALFMFIPAVMGLIGFAVLGTFGVIVGKLTASPPSRWRDHLIAPSAAGICARCKSALPASATRCPTCLRPLALAN